MEVKLPRLESLYVQGVKSLTKLKKAVEAYGTSLKVVEVHCLDLGLSDQSVEKEYEERDAALAWLKSQNGFRFGVKHSVDVLGGYYRSHDDQSVRRIMLCGGDLCKAVP